MEDKNKGLDRSENGIHTIHVDDMYKDWFLDYASYVILERAVPDVKDGLKPVQRRILHAMKEMDDGRFHKVANIIGQTMQYHPHGDAAIGDALVNLGQKDLLIDTQGNWGDARTGDSAAAARYIEARLTPFALEVAFNKETTEWQLSYDGRKKEPVHFPMKFPLVLAQGVEGIAVGLSTKILPHNFIELCKGSIDVLKGKSTKLVPDFPNGGQADVAEYSRGKKGGKVKVRCNIEVVDKRTLMIRDLPYGVTTNNLIDSIIKANDKGKIKIKRVTDNTAKDIEIKIDLPSGVSPDVTIDALYAFTNCQVNLSPNTTVIVDEKPMFLGVDELLKISTENTRNLLKLELEIKLASLEEKWHFASLEKIFIENRIYRDIEECETWEAVIKAIDKGLKPHVKKLKRAVTEDDIVRLTEIKIKRISKFDSFKADEILSKLQEDIKETKHHLKNLTDYAIAYFNRLIEKYGKGRERRTEIRSFDSIEVTAVAANNKRLYVNRKEGFIGYGLKKDEFIAECSDIDDIIVFRKDGKMMVSRIDDKKFMGKDIIHAGVWKRDDDRTIYHMIYANNDSKKNFIKRFAVTSITRDKEYDIARGKSCKVVYFTVHPNSEEEIVKIHLQPGSRAKNKTFEFNFAELAIKGRSAKGNILTKYSIKRVDQVGIGSSTLGGVDIWLDESVGRLNKNERGRLLGNFDTEDKILVIYKNGNLQLTDFELTNRYEMAEILEIEKFDPEKVVTAIYFDGASKKRYVKRFKVEAASIGKPYSFISEHQKSKLEFYSLKDLNTIEFTILKGKQKEKVTEKIELSEFISVKGWKALGNRLSQNPTTGKVKLIDSSDKAPKSKGGSFEVGQTIDLDLNTGDQKELF
ncbi:MAG: DNA gyrase/topoisomerase IV subunit A [Bacteroidia bacterium]|nr:DNA gyrase/topoisomerase IV subunit A [Bacteroidia bacterium]